VCVVWSSVVWCGVACVWRACGVHVACVCLWCACTCGVRVMWCVMWCVVWNGVVWRGVVWVVKCGVSWCSMV